MLTHAEYNNRNIELIERDAVEDIMQNIIDGNIKVRKSNLLRNDNDLVSKSCTNVSDVIRNNLIKKLK